jgi:FAD/FMN-containing dehydrogenase
VTVLSARAGAAVSPSAIAAFRRSQEGPVLEPGEPGYDEARQIWNAMIRRRPGLIARCASVTDVQRSVAFARQHDLLVSVRGGGHNIAGLALCDDGLTIDLSPMKRMSVDAVSSIAIAESGLTWGEFDRETARAGLATTGGAVSTTGIAGLTLGGGLGWLMGRFGYTVDNLLSAEVVLADSQIVTVSAGSHPDLFWALRGGGGNFGVVTSFKYVLHPVGPVLAGLIGYPLEDLPRLLAFYTEAVADAPDALTVHLAVMTLPTGDTIGALVPVWSGENLPEGERWLARLRSFGPPLMDTVSRVPYTAAQSMLDAAAPHGRRNYWKSSFLRELPDEAGVVLAEHISRKASPYSVCLIEHVHGAASRMPADATAFAVRSTCFHFIAVASWDGSDDTAHIQWAREFWAAMQPWVAHRTYANILAPDETDRIREAYGTSYSRLARIKSAFDPANLFRVNHNIEPATAGSGSAAFT